MAIQTRAVEGLELSHWKNKSVLVTGHTGFKGSWLTLWLLQQGAKVTGFSLLPDTNPALFDQLSIKSHIDHVIGDIRHPDHIAQVIEKSQPDVLFHLAAQSLVLPSYQQPILTWQANTMGTVNVLEGLRSLRKLCAAVIITTDKVYENPGHSDGFSETDALGGHDPYSASKAAAELAASCWRNSFYHQEGCDVRMATARAGNVIGGGDWADNRIIPDLIRALNKDQTLQVRNPNSVRPWQHVLEPVYGYLNLAQKLLDSSDETYQDSFNFGPPPEGQRTVGELIDCALKHWNGSWQETASPKAGHEAEHLTLKIDRARNRLSWRPRWSFERTVKETMLWYRESKNLDQSALTDLCTRQIERYTGKE